jgi:hypothetical protein
MGPATVGRVVTLSRDRWVQLRASDEERLRWQTAALRSDCSVSAFIRDAADTAAKAIEARARRSSEPAATSGLEEALAELEALGLGQR